MKLTTHINWQNFIYLVYKTIYLTRTTQELDYSLQTFTTKKVIFTDMHCPCKYDVYICVAVLPLCKCVVNLYSCKYNI